MKKIYFRGTEYPSIAAFATKMNVSRTRALRILDEEEKNVSVACKSKPVSSVGTHHVIYTDGACLPNPGSGGWSYIILVDGKMVRKDLGGEKETTNNRMETMAVIKALEALTDGDTATVYTDSQYVIQIASRPDGASSNKDLWEVAIPLIVKRKADFHHVRAHQGNKWNETADWYANMAANEISKSGNVPDVGNLEMPTGNGYRIYIKGAYDFYKHIGRWAFIKVLDGKEVQRRYGEKSYKSNPGHYPMEMLALFEGLCSLETDETAVIVSDDRTLRNCAQRIWRARKHLSSWQNIWDLVISKHARFEAGMDGKWKATLDTITAS